MSKPNSITMKIDKDQVLRALSGSAFNRTTFQKESVLPDKSISRETVCIDSVSGATFLTLTTETIAAETPEPKA